MNPQTILLLEELAANAWPPLITQHLDGWRLRASEGVHGRANSVWPNDDGSTLPLAAKLAEVEAFYQRRGLPPRYQMAPAMQPADLDQRLAEQGYELYEPVEVQTAVLSTLLAQTTSPYAATITPTPSDEWLAFDNHHHAHTPHQAHIRGQIMRRIGPAAAFAAVEENGRFLGIGLGVCERGWLGIFNMLTDAAERRRGVGTAVLHHLATWATHHHATHAYLQVVATNRPAQALYARASFTHAYSYHYRLKRHL